MKKFLVGLLTVALAASMLVGCGKKEEKKKADNSLKDVRILRLAACTEFAGTIPPIHETVNAAASIFL